MLVLLVFAPFAIGGATPWSRECVLGITAVMAVCLAGKLLFGRDVRFAWSWAYLPIVLFMGFVAIQLVALPADVVGLISPHTLETKARLLADMPDAPSLLRRITISFYPLGTRTDLRMVLSAATVFVVVVNVYRRPAQIKRLLWIVAAVGGAVGLLAAYQNFSHASKIYGIVEIEHFNSGPFLNHSHFGQFMNMSIGAMLGLVLVRLGEITDSSRKFGLAFAGASSSQMNVIWSLVAAMFLCAVTIFLSGTRAGVFTLLLAGVVTAVVWIFRRKDFSRSSVIGAICVVALLLMIVAAFDQVYGRLATVLHVAEDNGSRWQVLKDISVAWRQFPLVGTGLGTHEYVFPMFDHSTVFALARHAENEYAELMEECGVIGLALCVTFLAIIVFHYLRCIWTTRQPIHLAAYGLGFGLVAILVHSFSDFGQHAPPNFALTAVFFGLLISLSRRGQARSGLAPAGAKNSHAWLQIPLRVGTVLAVLGLYTWAILAADCATRADFASGRAQTAKAALHNRGWANASVDEMSNILRPAAEAAKLQPDNVIAQYWLADYRWHAISRGGLMSEANLQFTRRIIAQLHAARATCPTYAQLYCLAGQLERSVLHLPEGERHIRMAYQLDACNPDACYAMMVLDAEQGRWDESLQLARRTTALDNTYGDTCVSTYVGLGRPDLAYDLVAGNRDGLNRLAGTLSTDPKQQGLVARCLHESSALLAAEVVGSDAGAGAYAAFAGECADRGEDRKAIEFYQRALARDYGQVDWRFRLAVLLQKSGQLDSAAREARACLGMRPQMREAADLLDNLNARLSVNRF